jgi:adenylate cyclase
MSTGIWGMANKPTYEELEQRVKKLEADLNEYRQAQEQLKQARDEELQLLEMTTALSRELNLGDVLSKIMHTASTLLSSEKCTLFMYDDKTKELWARATLDSEVQDLRIPCHIGITGLAFTTGKTINIPDAYADPRFNQEMDKKTGFRTRSILCMPIKNKIGRILGVIQTLNKQNGPFTEMDEKRLEAFSAQACVALENAKLFEELLRRVRELQKEINEHKQVQEQLQRARDEESQLLEMTNALSYELNLGNLLLKIMNTTKILLSADRCTLFMYDDKTDELWARATEGSETKDLRFPSQLGIAGSVFTTGETINIPDAYADRRFNQEIDRKTGYRTKSILCMPIKNKNGQLIGVTQVLNKQGGPFTEMDEKRLEAFSAQASIALENAKLFEDVLNMKNYNEGMLESMSNGIISLDADEHIVKCNTAALRILQESLDNVIGSSATEFFSENNSWVLESIEKVMNTEMIDLTMDTDLILTNGNSVSVNLTVVPLINVHEECIGSLLVLEDITKEKRLKGTMTRYMAKEVVDKLLEHGEGEAMLGGMTHEATIMFSDIRGFTTISEKISPQETVSLLNEYFSIMVDVIFDYEGILDKYIGDGILAVFGAPFGTGKDTDRAVKTAIGMLAALEEFNRKRSTKAKDPLNIGIGISTDNVLAGNIGSLKRMDYTVIGDGVNLASRLEGANKVYGTHILVSEFTYKKLADRYVSREIDLIQVKGRTKPIGVYQILSHDEQISFPHLEEALELFHEGLTYYRQRDWQKGIEYFRRVLTLNENDSASRLYLDRCRHFAEKPPPNDWDHVWALNTK